MKKIILIILLTVCITKLYGQNDVVKESISANFAKQLLEFPQEKIYLHTDKPYYISGEKIFFRAFLLDAFSHKELILSRYVYVELINPIDSVVQRVKIRPDMDNLFHGAISIPEDLTQGNYKIRAYTQYMSNQGENSFFTKSVYISDPYVLSAKIESNFQFIEDGKVNASFRFFDTKIQEVIRPQSINMRLNQEQPFTAKLDREGWINVRLNLNDKATKRALYIELINDKSVLKQYVRIPYPESLFDVSFYPEGGHIIAEQTTSIAFKAVNSGGAALDITGEVVDSKGNKIAEIKTFHDGMGDFLIIPEPDEHYQAICRYGNKALKFDLPKVQTNTYALKTVDRDNKIRIAVNKYKSASYPELYLMIHSGGLVFYIDAWNLSNEYISFDKSIFPTGISHIVLLTKDLQIVSERLFFVMNDDLGIAEFKTQKNSYQKRGHIQAEVNLRDFDQYALKGNFSIAVTNDNEVITDTTLSIFSGIIINSELRGNIENPEYYFQKGNKNAEKAADLLMKTHGWTRYAIPNVVRGDFSYPVIPFEESQKISGTVKSGLLSNLAKNFNVTLISLDADFLDVAETDDKGRYTFDSFEFPDSTAYIVQALNAKGKGQAMTELYLDTDTFPGIHAAWIVPVIQEENESPLLADYIAKANLHYTYENGVRTVNLPEVQIKARKENQYKTFIPYIASHTLTAEQIERSGAVEIKNLLSRFPGVFTFGNSLQLQIRGNKYAPLLLIDGMQFISNTEDGEDLMDLLSTININDVGQIDLITLGSQLIRFGPNGAAGVISIFTKSGAGVVTDIPYDNVKRTRPLGYQTPVEFYSPKYDSQESINDPKPDLRTTIYWKPNAITNDEGNIKLDFYTADDPATYSVIIEGISDEGNLIHYHGKSVITVK